MSRHIAALLVALVAPALAEPLAGTVEDPSLRRKIDLVYLEKVEGNFPPTAVLAVMNQHGNTYRPHVLPVLVGSKVRFQSEDKELHNVFARAGRLALFNEAILPGNHMERTFAKLGIIHLTCNIHKEMSAFVVVLQNPYFATLDHATGGFLIAGVPAGSYTLRVWGEALTDEQNAKTYAVKVPSGEPARVAVAQ